MRWIQILRAFRVKKKKQIDYEKFVEMNQRLGSEPSEEDSIFEILKTFYSDDKREWTECISEFNQLIQEVVVVKLNLDFENKEAKYFIIADTYLSLSNLVSLYNHLKGSNKKSISVSLAIATKNEFLKSVEHFKEKYEWIYNPPILPGVNKHTIGRQLRSEFVQDYGVYAEITYLLSNGNALKFDEVNKMKLSDYLALGEYILRKKSVESVE